MAEMMFVKMHITPEIAKGWLEKNPRNRNIIKQNLLYLKGALIRNGGFDLTHQAIAITENGEVVDGQHRLMAIVETGISTDVYVCLNAKRSVNIDTGRRRSEKNQLYMAGIIEKDSQENKTLVLTFINFMTERSLGRDFCRSLNPEEKHYIYLRNKVLVDAVMNICENRGTVMCSARSAPILYAVACAYNAGVPSEKLKGWYKTLQTMDYYVEGDDLATKCGRSVILLSKFINEKRMAIKASRANLPFSEELIKKCESSIRWYAASVPIAKIYGEYVYPDIVITADQIDSL